MHLHSFYIALGHCLLFNVYDVSNLILVLADSKEFLEQKLVWSNFKINSKVLNLQHRACVQVQYERLSSLLLVLNEDAREAFV